MKRSGPSVSGFELMRSWRWGSVTISVATPAGWMVLTRMSYSPSSAARDPAQPDHPVLGHAVVHFKRETLLAHGVDWSG